MKHVLYIVLAKGTYNILVDTRKGRKETVQIYSQSIIRKLKHVFPGSKEKTATDSKLNFNSVCSHLDINF